jgi:hypothetical protein
VITRVRLSGRWRRGQAGRGELAVPLPAGYARRPSGEVALDPDEQVQAVVWLAFGLFDELGTVHAVLRFLVEHQVQAGMRERSGPGKGEVVWRAPHQQGLVNMLRNPAYAGIYAYGRSRTGPSRRLPGREHSGRVRRLDVGRWLVRIEGALPACISVEQYERNLARLAANRARAGSPGAPREGPALLGGLVVCGICGHRLQVNYEASGQGLTGRHCCQRRHHATASRAASRWPPGSSMTTSSPRSCRRWPRPRWSRAWQGLRARAYAEDQPSGVDCPGKGSSAR